MFGSDIPSRSFARALMDIAARGPVGMGVAPGADAAVVANGQSLSLAHIRTNASRIENAAVRRVLIAAIDSAQRDFVGVVLDCSFCRGGTRVRGRLPKC